MADFPVYPRRIHVRALSAQSWPTTLPDDAAWRASRGGRGRSWSPEGDVVATRSDLNPEMPEPRRAARPAALEPTP